MKKAANRLVSTSTLLGVTALVAFFYALPVHADVRIASQTAYDTVETAVTTHVGFTFTPATSGTVQSIAVGVDQSCGTLGIGQLTAGELVTYTSFSAAGAITGGRLWTGSYAVTAGQTYYVILGTAHSVCTSQVFTTARTTLVPANAQDWIVDVNSQWVPSSSAFNALQYTVCTDATCSLYATSRTTGIDWNLLYLPPPFSTSTVAIATSSSLWGQLTATDTLNAMNGQCAQAGNIFAEALCTAGAALFVPNPAILNSYVELASTTLPSKFPFSWYYGVKDVFGTLSASSTSNMVTFDINMASVDPATSTPFGNILPDVVVLSSTTITRYLPQNTLTLFLTLESAAMWVLFGIFIFRDVQHGWLRR